ncbi:hypothetical protein KR222_008508, partial [Zaprionus bogoriensis]
YASAYTIPPHLGYNSAPPIAYGLSPRFPDRYNEEPELPTPPSESYFVHCQDALSDRLPRCVINYRRRPVCAESIKQRHLAAEERHQKLLTQRKERLAEILAKGAQLNAAFHRQQNRNWWQAKAHVISDMQDHVNRREYWLIARTEILRAHHALVESRSEMLRYGNYLRRIAQTQEERRKRKSIF